MTVDTKVKQQIYQIIETLPIELLPTLLGFLRYLLNMVQQPIPKTEVAPIYQMHNYAIDTGVSDLAANHDHYLYGMDDNNA